MSSQSSLITTNEFVKKILIVFAIFAVIVVIGQFCLSSLANLGKGGKITGTISDYQSADNKLGALLPVPLTSLKISSKYQPSYEQDNQFASLPFAAVNIYKINEPREKFNLETNANKVAENLKYKVAPERKTVAGNEILTWNENGRLFQLNKVTQEWKYYNPSIVPGSEANKFYSNSEKYKTATDSIIRLLGLPIESIDGSLTEVDYLVRKGNSYVTAVSPNAADFVKLRIFRRVEAATPKLNIQVKPVNARTVIDDYLSAPLEVIISTSKPERIEIDNIVSFKYFDWEFSAEKGVYEIITTQQAWDNVKSGGGALKELLEIGFNKYEYGQLTNQEILRFTADYQKVELVYLEPPSWTSTQNYLYPIYIFKGKARLSNSPEQDNGEFTIYVPALKMSPKSTA